MTIRAQSLLLSACLALAVGLVVYFGSITLHRHALSQSPAYDADRLSRESLYVTESTNAPADPSKRHLIVRDATGQVVIQLRVQHDSGAITDFTIDPHKPLINQPRLPIATLFWLAAIVTISLFSILAVWINRAFIYPIEKLSVLIKQISAAGNLSLRVPPTETPLLGAITDSVNNILETTAHSYLEMLNARYEAETANKGKSLFIAKVSHELRTPIHSITGMFRILLKQEQSPGKRQYIQMAKESADALLYTINEVLDFSKMQSGSLSLERESFSLIEVVRTTVENLIPRFEEKPEVAFCWDVSSDVPEVVVSDPSRVKNILVNLLGNGFKFTDHGFVQLEVSSYHVDENGRRGVRFTVSDSGIGIAPDKQRYIFDPFTTADEKTARLYSGTGLGLAIVKQIVEHMGGSVSLKSTSGEGSEFTVNIPFEVPPEYSKVNNWSARSTLQVAVLAEEGPREHCVSEGLRKLGCSVTRFRFDNAEEVAVLTDSVQAFDIIHVIKSSEVLIDELTLLIRAAAQHQRPLVLSVLSSELASTGSLVGSDVFFETLQPTSALDVLLIASGKLRPNTSIVSSDETQEKASHKLNILVADDAKTNRIILKTLLEEAGHSVELVENGKQLLDKITTTGGDDSETSPSFDLVLTDIQMPVMDGLTATQNFRELERKSSAPRKLPIVAVTSYALPEERSKMLALGIDHIITKPISPRRLSRLLSQIGYETLDSSNSISGSEPESDVLGELCRVAENVVQRVSSIAEEITRVNPMPMELGIDIRDVYERSGNSIRRTGLILSGFIESYREPLSDLEDTEVPVRDPAKLRRAVHSLKGLLLDAGAKNAGELATELEKTVLDAPETITRESIEALSDIVRSTVLVVKEIAQAIPSLEVFSALPSIDAQLTMH